MSGSVIVFKKRTKSKSGENEYIEAIHLLLADKKDEALDRLKRTIKKDSGNIMAYITLGDILRDKGYPLRAVKIHRNLLVRGDLTESQIETILHHLVLDYQAGSMFDKAVEMSERLIQRNKKRLQYQELLIRLCEEKGDWERAFTHTQNINKWRKRKTQDMLALYKVQSGLDMVGRNAEREGRIRFREALKFDKKCIPAYLYWGDSYKRDNRLLDACKVWKEFTEKNPEWAHLAFERLKGVLFDLGRYGEMEGIYQEVIGKNPKHTDAYISLAELYRKEGRTEEAMDMVQRIIDKDPESLRARLLLAQLFRQTGDQTAALEQALKGLEMESAKASHFSCSNCGNESKEPLWYCPQCHAWNTYINHK
jgi:lipopolysaccharide biosynthesis regulator YciM